MKRAGSLFKRLFFIITIAISADLYADAPRVKGYYIDKNGVKSEVNILIWKSAFSDKLVESYYQNGFKYFDNKGKKNTVDFSEAVEFGFTHLGEEFIFRAIPKKHGLNILGPFYEGIFGRLILDGPCELYTVWLTSGNRTDQEFLMFKNKTDVFVTNTGIRVIAISTNKHTLAELFSECPELVSRIKNKEYKKGDDRYIRMVAYYNNSCRGEDSNPSEIKEESQTEE